VNYTLSSLFFLASRLSKATVDLAGDASISKIEQTGKASLESYENKNFTRSLKAILMMISRYCLHKTDPCKILSLSFRD
jgi:hypothetical protein